MLKSFRVSNFRCFRDLKVEPLARINLIAGKNNVGKTTLLEALWLHLGPFNPALCLKIDAFRGLNRLPETTVKERLSWLFAEKRQEEVINLVSTDDNGDEHKVHIRLIQLERSRIKQSNNDESTLLAKEDLNSETSLLTGSELIIDYSGPIAEPFSAKATFDAKGIDLKGPLDVSFPPAHFHATSARNVKENADRFSKLVAEKKEGKIIEALQAIEPNLQKLEVLTHAGEPMIYADIGLSRLIPIPLMGEGTSRLLSIVLHIVTASGGVVLVDEIENGFHHSVMEDIWRVIIRMTKTCNTQLFATTHSSECIRAVQHMLKEEETPDFALHRLEQVDGEVKAIALDMETLSTAVEMNYEVR